MSMKATLRHKPIQLRSQRKVEQILAISEEIFAEVGYERATTNLIAQRAGISIGSLYQFFTSKEAILQAIAERYLEQTKMVLRGVLERTRDQSMDALVSEMLEALVEIQDKRPYFLQCLGDPRPSEALGDSVSHFRQAMQDDVVIVLMRKGVEGDAKLVRLKARICSDTIRALLPLVLYARGQDRNRVISEVKQLLLGYLVSSKGD